jgi:hypothetical protein
MSTGIRGVKQMVKKRKNNFIYLDNNSGSAVVWKIKLGKKFAKFLTGSTVFFLDSLIVHDIF